MLAAESQANGTASANSTEPSHGCEAGEPSLRAAFEAETDFWACLGPSANELGLSRDLFVEAHEPLSHFDAPILMESRICECLAYLRRADLCGHTPAGLTADSFSPWCLMKATCPRIVSPLLQCVRTRQISAHAARGFRNGRIPCASCPQFSVHLWR